MTCHCTSPEVLPMSGGIPWCGQCGRDIHRDTLERMRRDHETGRAAAERDTKDLLYSLGAP